MFNFGRLVVLGVVVGFALSVFTPAEDTADATHWSWKHRRYLTPTPLDFDKAFVYLSNAKFNPFDPDFVPPYGMAVEPQFPGFLVGIGFQMEVMERSLLDVVAYMQEAMGFMQARFGLDPADYAADPNNPTATDRLRIMPFMVDPRTGASVHWIGGEGVPGEGIPLKDGGFVVQVLDPAGYEMSNGQIAPFGAMFPYGDYKIEIPWKWNRGFKGDGKPHIHYQANGFIPPNPLEIKVDCELISPEFGHGTARGTYQYTIDANGDWKTNLREILTFGGEG